MTGFPTPVFDGLTLNGPGTVPTPPPGTANTQFANTAFVASAIAAAPGKGAIYANLPPYNATGNGSTDDTAAIQAAVTAAISARSGVYLFPGKYKVSAAITGTPTAGFRFQGAGRWLTIIAPTSATSDVFRITCAPAAPVEISDLSVSYTTLTQTGGTIFNFTSGTGGLNLHDLQTFGGWNVLTLGGAAPDQNFYVTNIEMNEFLHNGIAISLGTGNPGGLGFFTNFVMNCSSINTAGSGIVLLAGQSLFFVNANIQGMPNPIIIDAISGGIVTDCTWVNVWGDDAASGGAGNSAWNIINGLGVTQRQQLTACWGSASGGAGFNIQASQIDLVNCKAIDNAHDGITLQPGCADILISGCVVTRNSTAGRGAYNGISVTGTCNRVSITGNAIGVVSDDPGTQQNYGVAIAGSASDFLTISGNSIVGNVAGAISNQTSGANNLILNNAGATERAFANVLSTAAIAVSNGTPVNVTSLSLPVGTWEISGNVYFQSGGSTTTTQVIAGVSTLSANFQTPLGSGATASINPSSVAGAELNALATGTAIYAFAAQTTVYLVGQTSFAGSASVFGNILAKKLR